MDEEVLPDGETLGLRPRPVEGEVTNDRSGLNLSPTTRGSTRRVDGSRMLASLGGEGVADLDEDRARPRQTPARLFD